MKKVNQTSGKKSKLIPAAICIVLLSGAFGYTGASLATRSSSSNSGMTVNQVSGKVNSSSKINDYSDLASKCGPSVVEITTSSSSYYSNGYVEQGAGSGVIISEDGYIVTNNHVIDGANAISVTTTDGSSYDASVIGADSDSDLAVIKIDASGLTPVTYGDSDSLEVGDAVIAIGNPMGNLGGTVTSGIISALDRQVEVEGTTMNLLQTDAALSPGNSGGGLFDANGNLVGVVNAKESSTNAEGLGFAIPINGAIDIIEELISNGKVTNKAALNVSLYDYNNDSSNYYISDANAKSGVYIVQIVEGGACDQAGLQQSDRIVKFDGQDIETSSDVKAILKKHDVGDKVEIVVERDGKEITKTVTLQESTN